MSSKGQAQIIPNPNVTTVKKNPTIMSSNPRSIDEIFIRVQIVKNRFSFKKACRNYEKIKQIFLISQPLNTLSNKEFKRGMISLKKSKQEKEHIQCKVYHTGKKSW